MSLRDWAELLRVSALFTVPGDALAGAASAGVRPNRGTALAVGASLCLYEAGMALNDWADRDEDAVERPHRPIPSGRITPNAALTAAGALTATGLLLASRAGRPTLAVGTALAASVWAYDLRLKHTAAGPAAMGAARALDVLMGATATTAASRRTPMPRHPASPPGSDRVATPVATSSSQLPAPAPAVPRGALLPAALLGAHTLAVTTVSRREVYGGSVGAPLAALGVTGVLGGVVGRPRESGASAGAVVAAGLAAAYVGTAGRAFLHAALNPSPQLTQRAVGGGIRAMIPFQAALAARGGAPGVGLAVMGLVPLARKLAKKVSVT